jgi:hypothetical protein
VDWGKRGCLKPIFRNRCSNFVLCSRSHMITIISSKYLSVGDLALQVFNSSLVISSPHNRSLRNITSVMNGLSVLKMNSCAL